MTYLRRALRRFVAAWLLCQAASLSIAPAAFWHTPAAAGAIECRCIHSDREICPMHQRRSAPSKLCVMQSAAPNEIAVLASLFGSVGLMPAPAAIVPAPSHAVYPVVPTATFFRCSPPDPPPPRA